MTGFEGVEKILKDSYSFYSEHTLIVGFGYLLFIIGIFAAVQPLMAEFSFLEEVYALGVVMGCAILFESVFTIISRRK